MEYTNSQIKALIDDLIHSARDRQVLYLRLVDGLTFEKIAECMELSVRYTKTIVYKNEQILFSHLPG